MKALIYRDFQGPLTVEEVPVPICSSKGVIIKVMATGLCRSDWHGWIGHDPDIKLPHVPGHEFAGIIETVGSEVKQFNKGDRVTVPFVCGCGECVYCLEGNQQVCNHQSQPGFTHWGSFAEYALIENADLNLVTLPESISFETAATLGCRFITSYRAVVQQAKARADEWIAIHGCGGIGLSAIQIAKAFGLRIIAVDINDKALLWAKKLGADYLLNASEELDVSHHIKQISRGGVHISIDALGSRNTSLNSIDCLRKRGRHIQVGLMTEDHASLPIPMDRIIAEELEIYGSHGMQAHAYPEMLKLIAEGRLRPDLLINQRISLIDAIEALPNMNRFNDAGVTIITQF